MCVYVFHDIRIEQSDIQRDLDPDSGVLNRDKGQEDHDWECITQSARLFGAIEAVTYR